MIILEENAFDFLKYCLFGVMFGNVVIIYLIRILNRTEIETLKIFRDYFWILDKKLELLKQEIDKLNSKG